MKKLINEVDTVVDEMLNGMAAAYPQYVKRLDGFDVLLRANKAENKVALLRLASSIRCALSFRESMASMT